MSTISRAMAALVAVFAFGASLAASAWASHPEFKTLSGVTLSFTGTSGKSLLLGSKLGIVGSITCEEDKSSGEIQNATPLMRKVEWEFKGKCEQLIGGAKTACSEPIKTKLLSGELGLINAMTKTVVLLLAPEAGEEVMTIKCGSNNTTVDGAVVGEIPEFNKTGAKQYNKIVSSFELKLKLEETRQAIREILLLGTQMTGNVLTLAGFFGGEAALETTETVTPDGLIEIKA